MQQNDLSTARARASRAAPALAERRLWQVLRNRRFLGLKVRRQTPLAGQIVDFYIPDQRLAIDLDPPRGEGVAMLAGRGFRLLHLDCAEVAADLPACLARIAAACGQRIDPSGPI
jgi:very-short-patch-repair endonuclease